MLTPARRGLAVAALVALPACFGDVHQIAGTGATYTTRCSAKMTVRSDEYFVQCSPPACDKSFTEVADNHVVVALDPGKKLVGYRERVCVQDLSKASERFTPIVPDAPAEEPADSPAE